MTQKTSTQLNVIENVIEFPQTKAAAKSGLPSVLAGQVSLNEMTSIKALTSYVAHNKNVPEDTVRHYLLAQFQVPEIGELRRHDYERVIRFLVDLQIDLIVN